MDSLEISFDDQQEQETLPMLPIKRLRTSTPYKIKCVTQKTREATAKSTKDKILVEVPRLSKKLSKHIDPLENKVLPAAVNDDQVLALADELKKLNINELASRLHNLNTNSRRLLLHTDEILPKSLASFCQCDGPCTVMPSKDENVCCCSTVCFTKKETFFNVCLDKDVLITAMNHESYFFCNIDNEEITNDAYRHCAYRQYILYTYGHLGAGQRRVCPSCVVTRIRKEFPSADGLYKGFKLEH